MEHILFFIDLPTQDTLPWYMNGAQWVITALAGSFIGAIITHYFTHRRDKKLDDKKRIDDLTGIGNSVCFYLALQQSELTKLKMNIKDRIDALQKFHNGDASPTNWVRITQDFTLCKSININIESVGKIILSATENSKDIVGTTQDIFISNEWYFKSIAMLERYHEAKQSIPRDEHFKNRLLQFIGDYFPVYVQQIEETISYGKKTLDSFRDKMFKYFGIKINVTMGDIIKLS